MGNKLTKNQKIQREELQKLGKTGDVNSKPKVEGGTPQNAAPEPAQTPPGEPPTVPTTTANAPTTRR